MFKHKPMLVGSMMFTLIGANAAPTCEPPPSGCSADSIAGGGFGGYTSQICTGSTVTPLPLDQFPPCNKTACQAAHCLPRTLIPANIDQNLLGSCSDASTVCVPDDYAITLGSFLPKTCTSLKGAEGRCISTCIPQVNGLMDVLPKANCGDYERCAPCINPNDGTHTGACEQGCDSGPSAQTLANPVIFQKCAAGFGVCAPTSVIPSVLLTQLTQNTCTTFGDVCAPIQKTQNLKYNFPACQPSNPFVLLLAAPGPNGQLGGCVPTFLADANPLEGIFMAQDSCLAGEKCAPCNNPLRGNVPTGACPVPLCSDPNGGEPPQVR